MTLIDEIRGVVVGHIPVAALFGGIYGEAAAGVVILAAAAWCALLGLIELARRRI